MELARKAQMEKTSARGEAYSDMRDIPRRERIALAVDEFYKFIDDEIRYMAEWYEIEAYELVRAILASPDGGHGNARPERSPSVGAAASACGEESPDEQREVKCKEIFRSPQMKVIESNE
jgi:hypothetical protein